MKRMATREEMQDLKGIKSDEEDKDKVEVKLTHSALGTALIKGKWNVVEVKFNPDTGDAAVVKKTVCEIGKDEARDRFRIIAAELDIV